MEKNNNFLIKNKLSFDFFLDFIKFLIVAFLVINSNGNLNSEEIYEGNVSGIWEPENSPYNINGDIKIPADSLLTILPGVAINFVDHYSFTIEGTLIAEGTESDSIAFSSENHDTGWDGIYIKNDNSQMINSDSTKFRYCKFEYGITEDEYPNCYGGALHISYFSKVIISDCYFSKNRAEFGGAIHVSYYSEPIIKNCTFFQNVGNYFGGAISCRFFGSKPVIQNNIFSENIAVKGGAIACESTNTSPNNYIKITDNTITNNFAKDNSTIRNPTFGAGIYFYGSDAIVERNLIKGNISDHKGGGILVENSDVLIRNNIIEANKSNRIGAGIKCYPRTEGEISNNLIINNISQTSGAGLVIDETEMKIVNNTISGNISENGGAGAIMTYNSPQTSFWNNIVWNNKQSIDRQIYVGGGIYGNIIFDFCNIEDGENGFTVDSTYITFEYGDSNINENPQFSNNSYTLQSSSPCIDSGLNDIEDYIHPIFDLSGNNRIHNNIVDMGCYEIQETGISNQKKEGKNFKLLQNYPNPFNPYTLINYQFSIENYESIEIIIYNSMGQQIWQQNVELSNLSPGIVTNHGFIQFDGSKFNSGIYYYSLIVDGKKIDTKSMILIK